MKAVVEAWWKRALAVLLGWAVLVGYAKLTDRPFSVIGLLPVALAVLAVLWFALDTTGTTVPPDWRPFRHHAPMRTFDSRFTRLRQDVSEVGTRPAAEPDIRRALARSCDSILIDRYGIDPVTQPDERARILGPEVTAFIDPRGPATRAGDLTYLPRLFAVLDRMETL